MRLLIFIIILLFGSNAIAEPLLLVGRWAFDGPRTLEALKADPNAPQHLIEAYERGKLPVEIVFVFESGRYWAELEGVEPTSPTSYSVSSIDSDQGVTAITINDSSLSQTYYFLNNDHMYGYAQHETYSWREYMVRVR